MSTQTHPTRTETETRTGTEIRTRTYPEHGRISTRTAPVTFSPHNTNPCPQMFADKWVAEPDGQR